MIIRDTITPADIPALKETAKLKTKTYVRNPLHVDAVQVTIENIDKVAAWCSGRVQSDVAGLDFIKVNVRRPLNKRQTQAFVDDWILFANGGYKVYTDKAFKENFHDAIQMVIGDCCQKNILNEA
jgi:hypothetical protein